MKRETQRQSGETWSELLKDSSMRVETVCPVFFCSQDEDFKGLFHGIDFCVVARRKQAQIFGKALEKRFQAKHTGQMEFSAGVAKELKNLNRVIHIDVRNDEKTLEVDTKFVEEALEIMKMISAEGVDSLSFRKTEEQKVQIENTEKLTPAESNSHRSLAMKLAYAAQDRVDTSDAVKCLTRQMEKS